MIEFLIATAHVAGTVLVIALGVLFLLWITSES